MSYFSCFFYGVNETLTYFLFQMNFVCQPSREIFHPLHFDLHMQMLEQQISGSQSKVLGVVLRYHPQLRMEGGIVGDTQCKAIQFVLLAVVVKVGKMDTDLLLTHNGYMLGGGNIETAVIAVTFRGAYLAAAGRSERVGRPQHDSRHVFPELPLLQHTQTGGKVAVLVRESAVPVWLQSQRLRLEERTRVGPVSYTHLSTPIGYQTNLIVQGIGNYKFTDFVRIGLPLNIITFLISIFLRCV